MATAGPKRENEQELRLALAMRGGASMAVWIGGAAAEINCLRRALASGRAHPWAALAKLAGYDAVSVDVLAGTSAGGLNATLLAASVVYGMPFDDMRGVWVRLADLEAMSRRVPKFWEKDPDSLLEGDDYFRAELARILAERIPATENAQTPGDRADLLLTATLLDPVVEQHFDHRHGRIAQQRRQASFRFRHLGRPGQPLSDFKTGKEFDDTTLRLAHAARATSSFPFAFEPAQVHSSEGKPPPGEPDMFGHFSETTADPRPFRVIDGGVLDNIPVAAAIESIAEAPAARPTDRWLLYLNPEPTDVREDRPLRRQLALPVVSVALQARLAEESLLADIEALEEHNRNVERTALRRRALFAELNSTAPADRPAALARRSAAIDSEHRVVRAELDAQAVCRLLTEPAGSEDGKLLPPVVGDPLTGWSAAARTELPHGLSARLGARAATDDVFADVRALLAGVQLCLSWVWDIERWAPTDRMDRVGECKSALYRLRALGDVVEAHADRYWVNAAKQEPIVDVGELDGWIDRVVRRRQRLQHRLPSPIRPLVGAVLDAASSGVRFQRSLAELADELRSIVESSGADAVADNGDTDAHSVDVVAEANAVLHRIADRLAAVAPERLGLDEPEQVGYELLESVEQRGEALHQLVVLTAPLDIGRVPGARINFLRVTGDQQTPLPFDALQRHERAPLWLEDKIRGGDLGNFASFLSARWRANDWMWGRVDAATSLLALLLDPRRLVRQNAELGPDGLCDALGAIASSVGEGELAGTDEEVSRWRVFLAQRWEQRRTDVRAELVALFDDPAGEHHLEETKKALSERLHWTIAASEIPYVAGVSAGVDPGDGGRPPAPSPERLADDVRKYDVGRQRLPDLGEGRLATVATRFGLLAYRAVRPSGGGVATWLARRALSAVKPALMAIVFALAAPRRAAFAGLLAASAVAFLGTSGIPMAGLPLELGEAESAVNWSETSTTTAVLVARDTDSAAFLDFSGSSVELTAGPAILLTVGFAVWWCSLLVGRARGYARWVPTIVLASALLAGEIGLALTGFRLDALGLSVLAAGVTWFVAVACRPLGRLLSAAVTLVVFLAPLALGALPGGAWLILSLVLTAYAQMVLLATVDVLRPRPRGSDWPTAPASPTLDGPQGAVDQPIAASE